LTNEELLDTALELFLHEGFERTGIDAIAVAAGMAKRTVYARYPDKTALFKAALKRAIEDWLIPLETLQAAETDNLEDTLQIIADMLLANIFTHGGIRLLRLSNAVSMTMPEIAAYNTTMGTGPTLAYLSDLFTRRLLPQGSSAQEIESTALAFLHLVVGGPASTAAWGVEPDPEELRRHARFCVHLFLHGTVRDPAKASLHESNERLKSVIHETQRRLEAVASDLKASKSLG